MTTSNELYRSVPYEQEYREVLSSSATKKGRLKPGELRLIKQRRLVKELENIAEEENIPMVENVAIVDYDRRRLARYVHFTEEGNLRLAEALRFAIEPYVLQKQASRP